MALEVQGCTEHLGIWPYGAHSLNVWSNLVLYQDAASYGERF